MNWNIRHSRDNFSLEINLRMFGGKTIRNGAARSKDSSVFDILEKMRPIIYGSRMNTVRAKWQWKNENVKPAKFGELSGVSIENIQLNSHGAGNDFWFDLDAKAIYAQLADELNINTLEEVSRQFGEVRLIEYENRPQEYEYHPNLGLFQEIREQQ